MWWWWAPASVAASALCGWQKRAGRWPCWSRGAACRPKTWNALEPMPAPWPGCPAWAVADRWRRRSFSMWASCVALGWAVAAWSMRPCCCVRRKRFSPTPPGPTPRAAGRPSWRHITPPQSACWVWPPIPTQDCRMNGCAKRPAGWGRSPASGLCHKAFSLVHRAAHMPIPFLPGKVRRARGASVVAAASPAVRWAPKTRWTRTTFTWLRRPEWRFGWNARSPIWRNCRERATGCTCATHGSAA